MTDQTNVLGGHKCLCSFQEFCLKYVEMNTGKSKVVYSKTYGNTRVYSQNGCISNADSCIFHTRIGPESLSTHRAPTKTKIWPDCMNFRVVYLLCTYMLFCKFCSAPSAHFRVLPHSSIMPKAPEMKYHQKQIILTRTVTFDQSWKNSVNCAWWGAAAIILTYLIYVKAGIWIFYMHGWLLLLLVGSEFIKRHLCTDSTSINPARYKSL